MKKINIAFIWHFHQPNYQQKPDSDFLLPWVRLHASKDYLDMLKKIDGFKNLKLNFNFSPILLDSLNEYSKGAKDLHLRLLVKDENKLSEEDKIYILNNYFDLNYKNMVLKNPYYTELYNRRSNALKLDVNMFSLSEYSDIMAIYTLLWIDETFRGEYVELNELFLKEKNYTLEDRKKIYVIQLDIIERILKEYKKYQDEGKIEISTSPCYHTILPLLDNLNNKEVKNKENLPVDFDGKKDAKEQIIRAIEKYEQYFERKPKGMWLSEQCVSKETIQMLEDNGFLWTVLDEGILSKTTGKEFIRDFEGNLENPFDLNINYKIRSNESVNILFADSFFANLLNFGYGSYDSKLAANDLYEKIKTIQSKLQNSPKDNHIITIAMDGENCWETYQNDGNDFLNTLYGLIDEDETLNTVLVSDFFEDEADKSEILNNLKSGSWINRNFYLWVGEPTKNVAWLYLSGVKKDFENYKNQKLQNIENLPDKENILNNIEKAYREILICEGSDWYWWYGEPNESKSDYIFDFLFRSHLMNVYEFLGIQVPEYLTLPLSVVTTKPLRNPISYISPSLVCDKEDKLNEWQNAGYIFIPDGPTSNISRLVKNIHFGYDDEYLYFRFELNKNSMKMFIENIENQIAIYFINELSSNFSSIRLVNKNENNVYPILKNQFSHELRFVFNSKYISRIFLNKAGEYNLWNQVSAKKSSIFYKDVIELKISFEDLEILPENKKQLAFCILDVTNELINEVYPQDVLITVLDDLRF